MPDPELPPLHATDHPAWVLFDTLPHIGRCDNAVAAARALTSAGDLIEVSLTLSEPPALSQCFVHCPGLADDVFIGQPRVTGAEGALLLMRVIFADCNGQGKLTDVFVYRAGPGEPLLQLLPRPYPDGIYYRCIGILPCGDARSRHYLVVIPEMRFQARRWEGYHLRVYSSETESWSTKVAQVADDMETDYCNLASHEPTKVVSFGRGLLGWIDLRFGILLCNVVEKDPEVRLIQLPELLPTNRADFGVDLDGDMPPLRQIQDVTYKNGRIRMIEVEFPDLDDINMDFRWRATVFETMAYANNWYKDCTVDSSIIFLGDSYNDYTFCEMLGCNDKQLTLNTVVSLAPTLDMCNDNVFYMMSKRNAKDPNTWVLAINTRDSTLEKVVPFSSERMFYFDPSYQQCAFSKFLGKAAD